MGWCCAILAGGRLFFHRSGKNCRIQQSIISEGCAIRDSKISNSIVGIRSVIRSKAEIMNTIDDFLEKRG